jgi:hypothetical protein
MQHRHINHTRACDTTHLAALEGQLQLGPHDPAHTSVVPQALRHAVNQRQHARHVIVHGVHQGTKGSQQRLHHLNVPAVATQRGQDGDKAAFGGCGLWAQDGRGQDSNALGA